MTNRLLLGDLGGGDFGLLISRAGIDVTTVTDPDDILFDSRELEYANSFLTGTTSLTFSGTDSSASSSLVSFGTTFSYIPVVLTTRVDGSGIVYRHCASDLWSVGILPNFALGDITFAYAEVTASGFTMKADRVVDGGSVKGGLPNGTHTFAYAVFTLGDISVTSVGP